MKLDGFDSLIEYYEQTKCKPDNGQNPSAEHVNRLLRTIGAKEIAEDSHYEDGELILGSNLFEVMYYAIIKLNERIERLESR